MYKIVRFKKELNAILQKHLLYGLISGRERKEKHEMANNTRITSENYAANDLKIRV